MRKLQRPVKKAVLSRHRPRPARQLRTDRRRIAAHRPQHGSRHNPPLALVGPRQRRKKGRRPQVAQQPPLALRRLLARQGDDRLPRRPLLAVAGARAACHTLVVPGHGLEGVVGNPRLQRSKVKHAHQRVAAFNVRVQEGQRLARRVALDPQRHLAQVNRQRVLVHAIDAVDDRLACPAAHGFGCGFILACVHLRQPPPDAPRRRQ